MELGLCTADPKTLTVAARQPLIAGVDHPSVAPANIPLAASEQLGNQEKGPQFTTNLLPVFQIDFPDLMTNKLGHKF